MYIYACSWISFRFIVEFSTLSVVFLLSVVDLTRVLGLSQLEGNCLENPKNALVVGGKTGSPVVSPGEEAKLLPYVGEGCGGTKNNCAHVQLGQILDQKIQKRQKEPSAISEELGPKPKVWQKQSAPSPTLNTTKGKADHLNYPTTTLTHVRKELGLLTWGDNRRARFTSYNQCRSPSTTLPEFFGFSRQFPSSWERPRTLVRSTTERRKTTERVENSTMKRKEIQEHA